MCECVDVHARVHETSGDSGGGGGVRRVGGCSSKRLPRRLPFLLLSVAVLLALSPSPGRRGLVCGCRTTIEKEKKCLKEYT